MGLMSSLRALFAIEPMQQRGVMWPFANIDGVTYPLGPGFTQTLQGTKEEIGGDFAGLVAGAYQSNGIVFACMLARASLFSEARFMYRQLRSGTPGELFSKPVLEILRTPWPGGTTGDLLSRAIQDVDLAGNAFFVRRGDRIIRLRPDWTYFVHGSPNDPNVGMWDPESELLGYAYQPGGPAMGRKPITYDVSEVAHFAPIPDPLAPHRGMSWLLPLIREIEGDSAATAHKLAFFRNGATPNLVVTGVPSASAEQFRKWVNEFEGKHAGVANAYRSLYLSPTMDAKVVGADLQQIDFKVTQGAGETRIAAAAGVPAAVVGISEGLQGSSLNAGNFAASMRRFADLTMRPLWRNIAGSLAQIVPVPGDAELWYDDRDIPALKDDIKDAAEVQNLQAQAIRQYVDAGFEPDSAVDAINAGDIKRLRHSGLYSVQLQLPVPDQPEPEPAAIPAALAPFVKPAAEADAEDEDEDAPKRDAVLLQLVESAERRADAAERRADMSPVVNVHPAEVNVTTPEVTVTIERGAVEVSAPVTVEPAVVNVTTPEVMVSVEPTPVTVEVNPTPVEVRNEVTVEPTPVTIEVEPTPVSITNEIPEPRSVTKRIVRDPKTQQITRIEESTDG